MRHLFIVNPVAGGKKNDSGRVCREIEALMKTLGEDYEIYLTAGVMDAAEKVKREAVYGAELRVYACGGDGTLSECAHGAAGYRNAAVTHYPCGTGNDFIKTFGEDKELFSDLEALVRGEAVPLDIIDVNGRKCIDIASVGIDARIAHDVHRYSNLPVVGKNGAYIVSLIVNLFKGINSRMRIETDDGRAIEGSFALACACNGRYYGGGFNPSRTALADDGLLEFFIVKAVNIFQVAALIGKYAAGRADEVPEKIAHISGRRIRISADEEFIINVDGESLYAKSADMRIVPGGVNFIMPRGSRFIADRMGEKEPANV